jgi:hypothetical protein
MEFSSIPKDKAIELLEPVFKRLIDARKRCNALGEQLKKQGESFHKNYIITMSVHHCSRQLSVPGILSTSLVLKNYIVTMTNDFQVIENMLESFSLR